MTSNVDGFGLAYPPFVHIATLAAAPAFGVMIAQVANRGFQLGRARHMATGMTVVTIATPRGPERDAAQPTDGSKVPW